MRTHITGHKVAAKSLACGLCTPRAHDRQRSVVTKNLPASHAEAGDVHSERRLERQRDVCLVVGAFGGSVRCWLMNCKV